MVSNSNRAFQPNLIFLSILCYYFLVVDFFGFLAAGFLVAAFAAGFLVAAALAAGFLAAAVLAAGFLAAAALAAGFLAATVLAAGFLAAAALATTLVSPTTGAFAPNIFCNAHPNTKKILSEIKTAGAVSIPETSLEPIKTLAIADTNHQIGELGFVWLLLSFFVISILSYF
ncbi:hypothetical protein N9Q50_00915 [Amylibacter sp.]|nr:hypothetical protein [Amylibacter sp.]